MRRNHHHHHHHHHHHYILYFKVTQAKELRPLLLITTNFFYGICFRENVVISVELKNSAVLLQISPPIFKQAVKFINLNVFFSDRYENKNRNRFEFGTSERMPLKEAVAKVQEQIAAVNILVTHGGAQYAKLLNSCGISVTEKIMFDTTSSHGFITRSTTGPQ